MRAGNKWIALLLLLLLNCRFASAQNGILHKEQAGAGINFLDVPGLGNTTSQAIEYPAGSGNYALNRFSFWVTGIDQTGDTVALCNDIFSSKSAWVPGPTSVSGTFMHVPVSSWNGFVSVSAAEIEYHKIHFADQSYQPPAGIKNWPAAFNYSGFPKVLAAYADANQNGVYDYSKGDYPFVPADEHVFTMGSDSTESLRSTGFSSHLDMSCIWFVPKQDDSIQNTIFFRTVVCNRGPENVQNLRLGMVGNMQIGNPTDNFLVTDVKFNSLIGINTPGGDGVYGNSWPAVAIGWLSQPAASSIYFQSGNDAVKGRPVSGSDFYNLNTGLWKTGKRLSFGGSGLDGAIPAAFIYSNGSDPAQSYKDWDETPGTAGPRTGLITVQLPDLPSGACKITDGFIRIIPGAPDSAAIRESLRRVSSFYSRADYNVGIRKPAKADQSIFPNPVMNGSILYFTGFDRDKTIEVFSCSGAKICELKAEGNQLKMDLKPGIYILKYAGNSQKLVVE